MVTKQMEVREALPSTSDAMAFLTEASKQGIISVDTETTGLLIRDGRDYIQGLSIAYRSSVKIGPAPP